MHVRMFFLPQFHFYIFSRMSFFFFFFELWYFQATTNGHWINCFTNIILIGSSYLKVHSNSIIWLNLCSKALRSWKSKRLEIIYVMQMIWRSLLTFLIILRLEQTSLTKIGKSFYELEMTYLYMIRPVIWDTGILIIETLI